MLVQVKDLNVGDEIAISTNSMFKYLRVLRQPRIGKKVHWHTKAPMYSAVRCSTRVDVKQHSRTWQNGTVHTWDVKTFTFTPEDHNTELNVDLNNRGILLIKKAEI